MKNIISGLYKKILKWSGKLVSHTSSKVGILLILTYLIAVIILSSIVLIRFEKRARESAVNNLEASVSATHDIIKNIWANGHISDAAIDRKSVV